MRICAASSWFSSTLILTSRTMPAASRTSFSSIGPSCLHGPHQGAQKSTITGVCMEASITSAMKLAVSESLIGDPPGDLAAPAAPACLGPAAWPWDWFLGWFWG